MRNLTVAATLAFAMGTLSQSAFADGCNYQSASKKNDLEPPAPATEVVKQDDQKKTTKKAQDS